MSDPRRPRAFRLDDQRVAFDDKPAPSAPTAIVTLQSEPIPASAQPEPIDENEIKIEKAQRSGIARAWRPSFGALLWSGLGGLVSLTLGLWFTNLIEALFAKAQALGWIGAAFAAVLLAGVIGVAAREIAALLRQNRIAELHASLARAHASDDRDAARAGVLRLVELYQTRPETARARAEVLDAAKQIIDGRDLIDIAERALMRPLDAKARAEIGAAAKRVSLVTALSPRAVLDVVFVAAQIIRVSRRIAEIYGGRPGLLGLVKLARSIGAHLVITGGMAVGDTVLHGLVGHGIAAKISSRMGEGVLNGLLTARVGLSALAVCRPTPFHVIKQPGVSDVAPFLFGGGKDA